MSLSDSERLSMISSAVSVFIQITCVTDGQTDGIPVAYTALSIASSGKKIEDGSMTRSRLKKRRCRLIWIAVGGTNNHACSAAFSQATVLHQEVYYDGSFWYEIHRTSGYTINSDRRHIKFIEITSPRHGHYCVYCLLHCAALH